MRSNILLLSSMVSLALVAGCGANTGSPAGTTGTGTGGGGQGGSLTTGGTGGATAGSSQGGSSGSASGGSTPTTGTSTNSGGSTGCEPGSADCNDDPADGCEIDTAHDVNNCGGCGIVCTGGPNAAPTCNQGSCGVECGIPGTGDCNGDVSDGCETDLGDDPNNCGFCNLSCNGQPCIQGACACAAETATANLVQLDLFIMLDQSGSMDDTVAGGGTKWQAVTSALKGFFADPANAGLGVGIQYFALTTGQACNPFCQTNADCGAFGPCLFFICAGCSGAGGESCNAADYAKAEIEIAPLNAAQSSALSSSINAHSPSTNTPTGPALQGAVNHAKAWAMAHPGHNVVAVLATDGDPTECDPQDIPGISAIAAAGLNGNPSIQTFVIGVGSSLSNLNAIAAGGGTGSAFLVDTNSDVVMQFKAALDAIQASALGCEYTIPQPQQGMLDYDKVNVQYTPGGGGAPQTILNVPNAAGCDPATGGWYYDDNANPTKIILCDTTCGPIEIDAAGKVDILLGCATEHI